MIDQVAILIDRARVLRDGGKLYASADTLDLAARIDRARALPMLRLLLDDLAFEDAGVRWRYIPAGRFRMGDDLGDIDERPAHDVDVNGFFLAEAPLAIDDVGMTPSQAVNLVQGAIGDIARVNQWPAGVRSHGERTPFVGLQYAAAVAVARMVKGRLPAELEWERAARGCFDDEAYPWGDEAPSPGRATFDQLTLGASRACPPNDYGLFAMAGNAWEWCSDVYDAVAYARESRAPRNGPAATGDVAYVIRGGSFMDAPEALRVSFRASAAERAISPNISVRPARDVAQRA